jgi:transcriptional regulator with XRE-family HTH domain
MSGSRGGEKREDSERIEHQRVAVAFGHVLRGLRRERAVSQEALAFDAAIDRTYPSLLERGLRHPTLTILLRLSWALAVEPVELVHRTVQQLREGDRSV